jgi:hypothetical protein
VEGEQAGRTYFKRMYDYLEDFYGHLQEIKAGRASAEEVAKHMLGGAYARPLAKHAWCSETSITI